MTPFQIALIGGLAVAFLVSNVSYVWLRRVATELDEEMQQRLWRRERRTWVCWRVLEYAGIACLMCGFLLHMSLQIRLLLVAAGMILFCGASTLRAWLAHRAFRLEAPGTPACRKALRAAVLVTIAEIILAVVVCVVVLAGANRSNPPPEAPQAARAQERMKDEG